MKAQTSAQLPAALSLLQEGPQDHPRPGRTLPNTRQPQPQRLCYFQNVLLPGRQNISHPPEDRNLLLCNELLQAGLPIQKQLELGPQPKGQPPGPDTDSQTLPGPLQAWGGPLHCPSCCGLCCRFSPPERKDPARMAGLDPTRASWASTVCLHTGHLGGTVRTARPPISAPRQSLILVPAFPHLGCVFWDSLPCSHSEPHVLIQPSSQSREPSEQATDKKVSPYQIQSCSFIIVTMLHASELEVLCAGLSVHQEAGTWERRPGERVLGARELASWSWVSGASML